MTLTPAAKEYLAQIGRKGGKAGKGSKARIKSNRRAASASWTPEARAKRAANLAAKHTLKNNLK